MSKLPLKKIDKPEDVLPKNEKALHKLPCRPPSINVQRFSSRNTYSGRLSNISDINQQKQRNLDVMLRDHLISNKNDNNVDNPNINNWWRVYLNQQSIEEEKLKKRKFGGKIYNGGTRRNNNNNRKMMKKNEKQQQLLDNGYTSLFAK